MTTQLDPAAATSTSVTADPTTAATATPTTSRRQVLVAAGLGAGALTLAACGSSSSTTAAPATAAPSTSSAAAAGSAAAGGGTGSAGLIALSKVPVGGAAAATDANGKPIIIAQPTAGQVVAFSAKCTHMGCTVAVAGAELDCPCHGSKYNALTGAVINGPAPSPLPAVSVEVKDGNVVAS